MKTRPEKGISYKGQKPNGGQSIREQKLGKKLAILHVMREQGADKGAVIRKANSMAMKPEEYAHVLRAIKEDDE